jgi:hypothetical protein
MSRGFGCCQGDSLTKARVKRLEKDVFFVIDQQQGQIRACELAKQSIFENCTKQLTGNSDAARTLQGQLGGVQTELGTTKLLLGDAHYTILQLQKDLSRAKTMSKLERIGYFVGGVMITYFTIKITR